MVVGVGYGGGEGVYSKKFFVGLYLTRPEQKVDTLFISGGSN